MFPRTALEFSEPRRIAFGVAVMVALALTACSGPALLSDADLPVIRTQHQLTSASGGTSDAASGRLINRIYRLGVGDRIRVNVFGEKDLSGDYDISVHGRIALPLIGDVSASGLTIQEFKEAIAARLADGYLKQPRVSVEVLNYRPFFVHGEVRSGGEFKYQPGVNLRDAIAISGGYTYRAEQSYVILVRASDGRELRVAMPSSATVLPGDNIMIPERFF